MSVQEIAHDAGDVTVVDRGYVRRVHILCLDLELVVGRVAVNTLKKFYNDKVNCIKKLACCKNTEKVSQT
jgi:hypothetical protein